MPPCGAFPARTHIRSRRSALIRGTTVSTCMSSNWTCNPRARPPLRWKGSSRSTDAWMCWCIMPGTWLSGPARHSRPEQLAELYDINVLGCQRVNRAALPHMRRAGRGLLVWIGSSSVAGGVPPLLGPYFAAKAGMDALAVAYARELAPFGIESSIVVPGAFTTGTNHFRPCRRTGRRGSGHGGRPRLAAPLRRPHPRRAGRDRAGPRRPGGGVARGGGDRRHATRATALPRGRRSGQRRRIGVIRGDRPRPRGVPRPHRLRRVAGAPGRAPGAREPGGSAWPTRLPPPS